MVKKRTPKELYQKANELYTNIRTIGKNGQSSKWAYYYCMCILNGKKDVPRTFDQADAAKINGGYINQKLTKKQYLQKMKEYCAYIERHKKLPNHVTILGKIKIKPKIWTAYCGYIFKVYYETGKLPASQPIKSNIYTDTTKKKYGHASTSGCDNRGQNNGYYCGPHSLQEIIRNLTGKVIKQSTLAGWAGTCSDGTDHPGLETAIAKAAKELGVKFNVKWVNFSEIGWDGLKKIIKSNNQDFLIHNWYRLQWGHYEVVNDISGSNVEVQNSLGYQDCGSCYCGYLEDRSTSEFRSYINGISQKSVMIVTRVD